MSHNEVKVLDWSQISAGPWDTLLLGNGFSIGINKGFAYSDLFENFEFDSLVLKQVIEAYDKNPENAMLGLEYTERTLNALQETTRAQECSKLHGELREAMLDAIFEIHPERRHIQTDMLKTIHEEFKKYSDVFTTNYDLIPYWALMQDREFCTDFMWSWERSNAFGRKTAENLRHSKEIRLYFLHGAIHLMKYQSEKCEVNEKITTGQGNATLQKTIKKTWENKQAERLFVAEGSSEAKLERIRSSDYLSWCLEQLKGAQGEKKKVVIFGSGLNNQDQHIWDALELGADQVAVSVRRKDKECSAEEFRKHVRKTLSDVAEVKFFWADTHPLGNLS